MSKDNSDIHELFTWWVSFKKSAKKSGDYEFYRWFLKEVQKTFSKLYAHAENQKFIEFYEMILKLVACELKETMIKYEKVEMKKTPNQMTDTELLEAYKKGIDWLNKDRELRSIKEQKTFEAGVKRLEGIETEMKGRGIIYG